MAASRPKAKVKPRAKRLDVAFSAKLLKSPKPGGWTYAVWPKSVEPGDTIRVQLSQRLA